MCQRALLKKKLINVKLIGHIKGWIFISAQEGKDCSSKGKRIHCTFLGGGAIMTIWILLWKSGG